MDNIIKVNFKDGSNREIVKNIRCIELAKEYQNQFRYDIIAAKMNNAIVELNTKITTSCNIEFLDLSNSDGNQVYIRGLKYLFIKAVKDVLGDNTKIVIEHSIDKGIYCEISYSLTEELVRAIENKMKELVLKNISFERLSVNRKEAIDYFKKSNRLDKVGILNFMTQTNITLYKFDNLYDYFFGEMPLSTSYIKMFELTYIAPCGIVLRFPTIYSLDSIPKYVHHQKLFDVFREYDEWCKIIGVDNVVDLNNKIINNHSTDIIKISEINQNNKLNNIAEEIYKKKDIIKVILIAGPSSSGKTTTAHKLSIYLKSKGLKPTAIGIDDYYVDRINTPRDENGEYDYESLDAIDIKLFNNHLTNLLKGEEVVLPRFNFITGEKEFTNKKMRLGSNDILIIEGLHGLNERLTLSIPRENKYKIYISPLTVLNIDNHNRISTTLVRKLRRMVRDFKYRGIDALATMEQWQKVRAGEEKYVFPFQDDADVIFNTALIYELSILKIYAEPLLFSISEESIYYDEARKIIKFLDNFLPIIPNDIPKDSIIREFIGESSFGK